MRWMEAYLIIAIKKIYSVLLGANKGKNKTVRKYRIQGTLMFIGFVLKVAGQLCK